MFTDIFTDDAFSLVSLTATINEVDHVPGRAGELAFVGVGEGVATLSVAIEQKAEQLSLIKTSLRGAPAPKETSDKRVLRSVGIPHIPLEDTIGSDQIQGVRQLGSTDLLQGALSVVEGRMNKMANRHDLTLEYHRLGALRGMILDADGTELTNLFSLFGVTQEASISFDLEDVTEDAVETVRSKCHAVTRKMKRNLKMAMPNSARIWAFCGDNFFDKLVENKSIKDAYKGYEAAERRLGANYSHGIFEFGGIFFENYWGTDDNTTVAIDTDECRLFLTGVPGLYAEYYAPGNFMDTANTLGLPRYARIAIDPRFNQFVELHTQQNPLPLCMRPKTLMIGTSTAA